MRSKRKDSPKNLPPAPLKLPLIGHLHLLMVSLPHHRLTELAKRHGSLMHLQLGELSHIVVSSPGAAKEETFIPIVKEFVEALGGFSITDLFPSIKLLPMISGMRAKLESDDETDDLLDVLLNLQDHGGLEFPLTTDNIKAVILDMLIAGTETSSTAVEWAMSEMMKNPRILEKAQAEVRQVYDRTGEVNESDLHELKYLKLVIKETLRLHPPLPLLIPRENSERCEINGYEIPAKTKVIVNAWAI
ncbi:hypothetical protein Gohar_016799, partial [Gossypium harknessii]|nr:hypothetical protein [Gossypium harknessii]